MDVVINTHSLGGHGLASRLRELGVRTMVALHLVEQDEIGAPIGNPHMALAYEHSYERFLVVSRELGDWCVAHGVPEQKILLLPNAPSYSPRDTAQSVIASRSARAPGPLRALFLGRLDAQKGLDRLAALIEATKEDGFEWRVIGKPVVLDSNNAIIEIGVALESPLHDPALLDAAYDWADVLVAPSRFEGAPLTLLEARRRGVTIIATRVGAVEEVMPNGGFLIDAAQDEAGILASFLDALRALASDAALLLSQAQIAARSPIVSWEQSLEPLLRALDDPQTPNLSSPSMGEN